MLVLIIGLMGLIAGAIYYFESSWYFCGFMFLGFLMCLKGYFEGMFYGYNSMGIMVDLLSWSLSYLLF